MVQSCKILAFRKSLKKMHPVPVVLAWAPTVFINVQLQGCNLFGHHNVMQSQDFACEHCAIPTGRYIFFVVCLI